MWRFSDKNAIDKLRKRFQMQQLERQNAGDRWQVNDVVFTSTIETPIEPRSLFRHFKEKLEKANLPEMR